MTADAAAQAVDATMLQGLQDAARDLQRERDHALAAGQATAQRLVKTGRPGATSATAARYDPAARLLREWYLTVYSTLLDQKLGRSAPARFGADAVEATAAQVARIRTGPDPLGPLRATGYLLGRARRDAKAAAVHVRNQLSAGAPARAAGYVGQVAGVDPVAGPILRHWYQRCYLAAVDAQMGYLKPLQAVTAAEAHQVAASVQLGQFRRIVGTDDIPLVTAHGTTTTDIDRRLAAGEVGVLPSPVAPSPGPTNRLLRLQVTSSWNASSPRARLEWAAAAGVPEAPTGRPWTRLPGYQQSRLIARWLDDHRDQFPPARPFEDGLLRLQPEPVYPPFAGSRRRVTGPPEVAAARMFNHSPHQLTPRDASFPQPAGVITPGRPASHETRRPPGRSDPDRGVDR